MILFPANILGKGSALAFKSAVMSSKPVFVVSDRPPKESDLYTVLKTNLFGIVEGYFCIPPVYKKTGLCYEPAWPHRACGQASLTASAFQAVVLFLGGELRACKELQVL